MKRLNLKKINMFKEYKDYINDNPEGYWFKRKLYGWGWTPVKWQGWAVVLAFIAVMFLNVYRINLQSPPQTIPLNFLWQNLILVIILIIICYKKGEKPRWQWGEKKEK